MSAVPPPGWYPERPGGALRYWDGAQWTEHVAGAASRAIVQPPLPAGAHIHTPAIWAFAVLPLVTTIVSLVSGSQTSVAAVSSDSTNPLTLLAQAFDPTQLTVLAIDWLVSAAMVVLAFADQRALGRAGVLRPFPWPWAFFVLLGTPFGLVYGIGRAVVLRRRIRRGLGPLWLQIGVVAVGVIVSTVIVIVAFQALFDTINQTGSIRVTPNV